ncbi:MAG: type I-E CRISPR-associated endonuclease Cas1e [Acidipropionibacterium sp.]|jgi:CRISPR-associated protein Cas1|nr:type I-E CRISPR-associated endonuclease Cas1e [Acidipropionibacterium sp.]
MWWLAEAQSLHQVSDRLSSVYVERCHIDRAENAVIFVNKEKTVRLPAAFIATLLLGPGTRITHAAVRLLADSGTAVSWVGEHGVRMYAHGLGPSRGSQVIERQAYLVSRPQQRVAVARKMYGMRFPGEDVSVATMQQLLGREGARVKKIYRENSDRTGVPWDKRAYIAGDAFGAGDDVNRLLSAGNSCMYGICHAAIVGVGASPALGFVHTGHALSFVLDVADLYKAEYSIPLAFDLAAKGQVDESDMRWALRDRFRETKFMSRIVKDVMELLMGEFIEPETEDHRELWAGKDATIRGGRNWGLDGEDIDELLSGGYLSVSGPEIPEQVDW